MTSTLRSQVPNQRQSYAPSGDNFAARKLCFIVGLVCIAGFLMDLLVIAAPPDPFALEWRVGFLQQAGDRSIILLFGAALLLYSQIGNRRLSRPLSLILLGLGVAFMLSSMLVIRDSLILQKQALTTIGAQSEQLRAEIEVRKDSPDLPAEITLEQFEQASQQVATQAERLKETARNQVTKAGIANIGNLVVVGMGFVGLGRFGLTGARQALR